MPRADRRPELLVLASNVAGECRRCIGGDHRRSGQQVGRHRSLCKDIVRIHCLVNTSAWMAPVCPTWRPSASLVSPPHADHSRASSSREVVHRHHEERNHHGCSLRLTGLGHITGVVAQKRDICCPQSASSPLAGTSVRRAGLNFRHAARGLSSRRAQPRPVSDGSDHNQSLLYWGALRSAVQSSDIGSRQKILQRIFCRRPKNRVQTRHNDPTMTPTASPDMQPTRPGQLGHRGGRHRP